jgi:hypothetical protein
MLTELVIRMTKKARREDAFLFWLILGDIKPLNGGRFEFLRLTFDACDMS